MSDTPTLGEQCQICGHTNPDVIETHHKLPQRLGGPDDAENLVSLCGSCHNAIERIYDDAFFSQLFEKVGYEVEETEAGELGREIDPELSPDREFPPEPVHVTVEDVDGERRNEYIDRGVFSWEELEERGVLKIYSDEGWEEYKEDVRQADIEEHGEVTEETEQRISEWEKWDPKLENYEGLELIHCGYCNRAFPEWEAADAARHLKIIHGVENPYLRESDNLSEWEKKKRVLCVKDGWNRDDAFFTLSVGGLDGGYHDDYGRDDVGDTHPLSWDSNQQSFYGGGLDADG